ncbi:hypothetical protein T8T21_16095 (plasmid) [Limimaricola variabilis]|uniref:hypothetical protein n=1 Tax=Limimaricola variabilis TaxID=1492771 RepID=UPI002AC93C91|nr:hypothetical protein [Limimaricola variabilis]WPY96294.1 hypothetical protein T8T21_16095 [Limimaricola variabilis]
MTPLYCPIYISTDRQNCSISPELAQHLVAPAKARNGDVVAICHEYHSTEAHFGREVVTYFVVHMDGALQFRSYCGLEASQQAPMAHLEMLLQEEPSIPIIVQMQVEGDGRMEGMQKSLEKPKSYSVYHLPSAIGILKEDGYRSNKPWTQDNLDELIRLVLPATPSAHAALAQYADLAQTTQLMRDLLHLQNGSINQPELVCPLPSQFENFDLTYY